MKKNSNDAIEPIAGEDKRLHTFPKVIILKVNVIVWLVFKLAYYDVAVKHISHCTMGTPLPTDPEFNSYFVPHTFELDLNQVKFGK